MIKLVINLLLDPWLKPELQSAVYSLVETAAPLTVMETPEDLRVAKGGKAMMGI